MVAFLTSSLIDDLRSKRIVWLRSGCASEFALSYDVLVALAVNLNEAQGVAGLDPPLAEFVRASASIVLNDAIQAWLASDRSEFRLLDPSGLSIARLAIGRADMSEEVPPLTREFVRLSELGRASRFDAGLQGFAPARASASVVGREVKHERPERSASVVGRERSDKDRYTSPSPSVVYREGARNERTELASEEESQAALRASAAGDAEFTAAVRETPARVPVADTGTDLVEISVFAPPEVSKGGSILVQVLLHPGGQLEAATSRAMLIDGDARLRANNSLDVRLRRGTRVTVTLWEGALETDKPSYSGVWDGKMISATFVCKVAKDQQSVCFPTVRIAVGAAVIGELRFKLTIKTDHDRTGKQQQKNERRAVSATRYRRVFLSYSSQDRPKALEVAQCYRAAGVEFFQDILSLEPGSRWESGLYKEIDNCDLFLLLWSEQARKSEWVAKEAQYALKRWKESDGIAPDIVPLVLEGPPPPPPHDFLQHLHFDDWMRYAVAASLNAQPKAQPVPLPRGLAMAHPVSHQTADAASAPRSSSAAIWVALAIAFGAAAGLAALLVSR